MRLPRRGAVRACVRRTDGGATLEFALGVVALLGVASVTFDLYTRIETDSAGARMAAAMADYVSRETAPDGDQMVALGTFLRDRETGDRVDLVYAVTSIRQQAGDPLPPPAVDWVDTIRLGKCDRDGRARPRLRDLRRGGRGGRPAGRLHDGGERPPSSSPRSA